VVVEGYVCSYDGWFDWCVIFHDRDKALDIYNIAVMIAYDNNCYFTLPVCVYS